jgi:predicted ATPase/DNA-binding SARP family transcriptional activator
LRLFGSFEARLGDAPLPRLRTRKAQWLLALLALRPGAEVERAWLAGVLWPDSSESAALGNLRSVLLDLRRSPGTADGCLRCPTTRTLNLDRAGATVDVEEFDAAIARGDAASLQQAVALYRGPLLEDCGEEWVFSERQAREHAYLTALEALAAQAQGEGDQAAAERWLRRAVAIDPLRESAQRALMRALAAGGNYAATLVVFRELRQHLHREINAAPDTETAELFQQLRAEARHRAQAPRAATNLAVGSPLLPRAAVRHNLPLQLTSFVGREREMAEVKQWLAATRLLTLTGSGGCGKTRLALQVAADLLDEYADGVWQAELAPLADPVLVPQTVATALGMCEEPGRPLVQTLADYLRQKSLLLLLDNCEHLLCACAELADHLLRLCPRLRILASSRQGLGIAGELTYRVPSLAVPGAGERPSVQRLTDYEAVQLFQERAAFHQPTFAVTERNAGAVAQVCQQLDGIPLAIELAAARVKALPVEQIAERLDDRFRLLTSGSRTALPRHQTLRALIDWSYDLLTEPERVLLRRLSVFTGGWTLEAAEAVCAGDGIEEWEALDLLTSLVDKSLVLYEERGGEARYRLLETVRQYARDRLQEAGEAASVRRRHLEWYADLAEQAHYPLNRTATHGEWVERLERELDNLRAALEWSTEAGASPEGRPEVEAGLRLAGRPRRFWLVRGYLAEVRERLARLLALPGAEAHTAARANALFCAGYLASFQGDYEVARSVFTESLVIRRELGDQSAAALSLIFLGNVALNQGDYRAARSQCEEGLKLWRETMNSLGAIAYSLTTLGGIAYAQEELDVARALLEESLTIWREWDDRWGTGLCLHRLGVVRQAQGDLGAARALYRESLTLFQAVGENRGIAGCLEGFAGVAMASSCTAEREDSLRRATRLFGAAATLRDAVGTPLPPYDRAAYEHHLAALRAGLGEAAFAAAWAEGQAMTLEAAAAYALGEGGSA